ncbi:hypothetical protein HY463_01020 [Candidatus Peregrinibacteria bacterium]|nr:hypothetical protein [Candidatus Peregrinibacteria bacterium]
MFVCLDIETTGLNPKEDEVIEIGILVFDGEKIIKEWSSFVKCPVKLPEFTKRLTGITDEMLKDAPLLSELEPQIRELVQDYPIVGHFIFFDINFLSEKNIRLQNKQLDTCQLAQVFLADETSYSLEVLVAKLGIKHTNAHRALDDVKANVDLLFSLKRHIASLSAEEKKSIAPILKKSSWPWAKDILDYFSGKPEKIDCFARKSKEKKYDARANLKDLCEDLDAPFLLQESGHTALDILNYTSALDGKSLIVVSDTDAFPADEDCGILKDPTQYLNENRFNNFIAKDNLDSTETMLALKTGLWLNTTQTGEKSELNLFKDEFGLWNNVCCREADNTSFYAKARDRARSKKIAVVDHSNFLRDRVRAAPLLDTPDNLVICEVEEIPESLEFAWRVTFGEKRFMEDLKHLTDANSAAALPIEQLANRISILFGLLGIMIQKSGDSNLVRHTLVIGDAERDTKDWMNIADSAHSVENSMNIVLAQIADSPDKTSFEKYLSYLCKSLRGRSTVLWLGFDKYDQPLVYTFPVNTEKLFEKHIWNANAKFMLFCHHGNLNDDFTFLKNELSLPDNMRFKTIEAVEARPLYYPETKISAPSNPHNIAESCHELSIQLQNTTGDAFLLVNSNATAQQFFYALAEVSEKYGRKLFVQNMSGGLGKILKVSEKNAGSNIYVGNADMLEFLLSENVAITFLAIHRLPFSHPDDPVKASRAKKYANTYKEFVLPMAALKFQKILNHFLDAAWQNKKILVLDSRIQENEKVFLG